MDFYRQSPAIGSGQLKKAIERNRRKQLQRQTSMGQGSSLGGAGPRGGFARPLGPRPRPVPIRPSSAAPIRASSAPWASSQTPMGYPTTTKWYHKILVIGGWIFCCILLGRLVFADRGVIDYYSQQRLISRKLHQNQLIATENRGLQIEIKRLKGDAVYQRKLVRKHLGVIAKDEYLILFAREKSLKESE